MSKLNYHARRFVFFSFAGLLLFLLYLFTVLPNSQDVKNWALGSDRLLLDQNNKMIQSLRVDFEKRRWFWTSLPEFSKEIQEAVIRIEDHRFYSHIGFDIVALARAFKFNFINTRSQKQGASTITMQLTDLIDQQVLRKNKIIKKRSLPHKILQLFKAIVLEFKWSKNEILETYLNLIHLKGELQGLPAMSFSYLNKSPANINSIESILLASLISSPNMNIKKLAEKACRNYLLINATVQNTESLTCDQLTQKAEVFNQSALKWTTESGLSSHYLRRLISKNEKKSVFKSYLDSELQKVVVDSLEKNVKKLKEFNVQDMSAIVVENKTGRIIAYVGAVSTSRFPHVDGVTSYRQAGSSLKPFFYAAAIDKKIMTAASVLMDDSTALTWGQDVYRPVNYDKQFYGPVSVREALGSSLNVPAVKTVMNLGLKNSYDLLNQLHFSQLKQSDFYGVSMALGAVEVRLDELVNAYRTLANNGTWSEFKLSEDTTEIESLNHKNIKNLFSPEASFIVSSIISDPYARTIGFGLESHLETPFWSAVKTGTSREYHDNWCVGFSEHYTVGVWAGNFDATAMQKVSGVSGAAPSWYQIMSFLHQNKKSLKPQVPKNIIEKKIRHEWQSLERNEYFILGTEPVKNIVDVDTDKKPQFVFPAEKSVIVFDPHQDKNRQALFIRYKGLAPEGTELWLNNKKIGIATSPFRLETLDNGEHTLSLKFQEKELTTIHFRKRDN